MAFGLLGRDVGGYSNAVNDPGGLGVSQGVGRTGVSYGDILSAALQYGSKPGSSGPMFGNMLSQSLQKQSGQPLLNDPNQKKKSSLTDVLNSIWGMFMGGA